MSEKKLSKQNENNNSNNNILKLTNILFDLANCVVCVYVYVRSLTSEVMHLDGHYCKLLLILCSYDIIIIIY